MAVGNCTSYWLVGGDKLPQIEEALFCCGAGRAPIQFDRTKNFPSRTAGGLTICSF